MTSKTPASPSFAQEPDLREPDLIAPSAGR